jgi:hypothetical protein
MVHGEARLNLCFSEVDEIARPTVSIGRYHQRSRSVQKSVLLQQALVDQREIVLEAHWNAPVENHNSVFDALLTCRDHAVGDDPRVLIGKLEHGSIINAEVFEVMSKRSEY